MTLKVAQILRRVFFRPSAWMILLAAAAFTMAGRGGNGPFVQAQVNPIVLENSVLGSPASEWDVSAVGDTSIQGFATDISVNKGQTVQFKVKTDSSNYRIDIYRLGYYGGAGAKLVAGNLVPTAPLPQSQPACLVNGITGLADCGNWAVSASWSTASAVSGIHLAKLKRTDTGGASHIVFIVRDDSRQADVVMQTSDTTWQAYNQYGGGSLYCGGPFSNAGTVYSCTGRATKVSYNRPFDTRAHDATSYLFNAEYPMVRWLEANGYNVKYISGVDTERLAADPMGSLTGSRKPKVFLSVGHDEYWSAGQRASVEAARDAGVNLAFFSGNEVYWKTRWEPSVDGANTPYRTLVSYKDTLGASNRVPGSPGYKLDPMPGVSTSTWRDTRFGPPNDSGRPENALIGQIWTVNSGTAAITVPASMASLRLWRFSTVAALTTGSATLGTDTLGYEWGEDLDNGFRPAGVVHLSSTTVPGVEKILDFGETVGIGTATHNLTMYRHASGALVFGAGTVQWSWGLDGNHDRGAGAPSPAMQQATVNLLADMGAQPGSVQSGLTPSGASTDTLGPTSTIASPTAGETVGSGDRVIVTGTASDNGGGVVAGVEVSVDGGTTWRRAQGTSTWTFEWAPGVPGSATIRARAIDDSANKETPGASTTVTVVPGVCPCSTLFSPAAVPAVPDVDDPSALELGLKFRSDVAGTISGVRFYKSANNLGTHVGNLWTATGTLMGRATFVDETPSGWQQVLFASPVSIAANTTYVVSYHTNVGHYSATGAYFATQGIDRPPLHAQASGAVAGNGVYLYGPTAFPTESFNATNYWVDVVFSSTVDTMAPTITNVVATPIDGSTAVITWNTDESSNSRVDFATDRTFPAATTLSVSEADFVTAHSVRLTGLSPTTVYYVRVRSIDGAGNEGSRPTLPPPGTPPSTEGPLPPTFTTPSPTLRDTLTSDFSAGTPTGIYVSETGDGELILAPVAATEFSGSALPANWSTSIWSPGGSANVAGGRLTVDGARVAQEPVDVMAGHTLEFDAIFTGDPYQHSGYGQSLGTTDEPLALFSTSWTDATGAFQAGGSLGVRTFTGSDPAGETRTNLGIGYMNAPHRYRIDWLPGSVTYYVDGVQVASHAVAIPGPMRPVAASDYTAFAGTIVVDWVRSTPYATTGTFLSRVFGASTPINWQNMQWVATTPPGTTLAMSVRTGNTPTPDGTWSPFAPILVPGALSLQSNYIQYRAELATADTAQTPVLEDVIISGVGVPPVQIITPVISWATPANITYGTALGAVQLNATVTPSVAGTFAYTPPSGTVLNAGSGQTLSVTFTPTDTVHYTSATKTVQITVLKATPAISWPVPAAMTYGTALGATQLNATANAPGTFVYTPASGTVLGGGAQALSVAFTPTSTANYNGATKSVSITVLKATPTITWAVPAAINSGTPLGAAQLNATANAPGTFAYTPPSGTVLAAGTQTLSVVFTPASPANYNGATKAVTITVVTAAATVTVTSSNGASLFGVPITLTATIMPASVTGSVTFKDGTTTLGSAAISGGSASITTSSLAVGTHPITAVYGGSSAVNGRTSAVFSQVISASAKVAVTFKIHALQDSSRAPKVKTIPVPNAQVKVFTTSNACVGNIFQSLNPKKWGQIFDGADGVGGSPGCTPLSVGTYQAAGTTNAAGQVTISVPPLQLSWTPQYIVIARATNFDYVQTANSPDPLYSGYPILMVAANTTRNVPLSLLATFNGKIVPGSQTEFFGSYLNIIQPEYMDWTEDQEQYPFVMVAQGGWDLTTSVTPPEGFIPDEPAIAASVTDETTAVQFTMTDVGSEWTETTVNHSIVHNGATTSATSTIPMIDKKATTARNDSRKVMHDSSATMLNVLVNDKVNHLRKPLTISDITPADNGTVVMTDDGLNVSYAPPAGYSGVDTFTYTIADAIGDTSTATVSVAVLGTPEVSVRNATAVEGNEGTTPATFNVVLSNQSLDPVTVSFHTENGTAVAGADYTATSGTVTFEPLVTSMPITVPVLGDTLAEFNEKFTVRVTDLTNATIAAAPGGDITITDDDPPEISIAASATILEGDVGSDNVAVVVTLSQPHFEAVFVNYSTADGTAVVGNDYLNTTGTLQFAPNTVTKTIYVPVIYDLAGEKTESFYVDLSAPLNGTLTAATRATVSIVNDDNTSQVFSTAADLAGGTLSAGAYLSETSGGEIMLAPSQGAEFSGTSLPDDWTPAVLAEGGMLMVANGQLVASGTALVAPAMTGAGRMLEFAAAFTPSPDQGIGFGTSGALGSPMAMFVIGSDSQLYARTTNGARSFDSPMSGVDWLGKPLRYQITWNAGNAQYYINGVLMITHSSMAWGAVTMRPVIIDTTGGDGALAVDWIRSTPYASSGVYTSPAFDAGDVVDWMKLTTISTIPGGTTSTMTYRTSDDGASWSGFMPLGAGGVLSGRSRYMQFAVSMTSNSAAKTPLVQEVTVQFKK